MNQRATHIREFCL